MIQSIALASSIMMSAIASFQPANDNWKPLRGSGAVVLMRHAIAPGTGDPDNFQLGNCQTQRNLSEEGRRQATLAGNQFRNRGIAVNKVLSSQWCRTLETATLLNLGKVQPEPILNSFFRDRRSSSSQTDQLRRLIREHQQDVIVMVTHQVNITELTGIVPRSGDVVIVKAKPDGEIQILGELDPSS